MRRTDARALAREIERKLGRSGQRLRVVGDPLPGTRRRDYSVVFWAFFDFEIGSRVNSLEASHQWNEISAWLNGPVPRGDVPPYRCRPEIRSWLGRGSI
jgi:hypothetical protein